MNCNYFVCKKISCYSVVAGFYSISALPPCVIDIYFLVLAEEACSKLDSNLLRKWTLFKDTFAMKQTSQCSSYYGQIIHLWLLYTLFSYYPCANQMLSVVSKLFALCADVPSKLFWDIASPVAILNIDVTVMIDMH